MFIGAGGRNFSFLREWLGAAPGGSGRRGVSPGRSVRRSVSPALDSGRVGQHSLSVTDISATVTGRQPPLVSLSRSGGSDEFCSPREAETG